MNKFCRFRRCSLLKYNPDEKSDYSMSKHFSPRDAASNATPAPLQPPSFNKSLK